MPFIIHKKKLLQQLRNKRNIRLIINLDIIQFSIKNILNDIILDCYNQTIKHIKKYNL